MDKPLISIAMATYNGEKFLEKQLDSILNQSYKNLEIIISDDKSSDTTLQILENYSKRHSNIKVYSNEKNLGYVKNFEQVISLSNGEYIALADQDDIWNTDKIEILFDNIGQALLIHTDCTLIDEHDNILKAFWKGKIETHITYADFLYRNVVTGCTVMFHKKLLKSILPFPENLAYHDWYLAISAARLNQIVYLEKSLIQYRQHNAQDTGASTPNKLLSVFLNPIKRMFGMQTHRSIGIKKQLQNLEAYEKSDVYLTNSERFQLIEAIEYYKDYVQHFIHLKMFLIGWKNRKNISMYGKNNYLYVKNFIRDIIG